MRALRALSVGICLLALFLPAGCSEKIPTHAAQPTAPQVAPSLPITEVVQTFVQEYDQTWDNLIAVLTQRGIDVQMANKELGRLVTTWVPIQDFMCGTAGASDIPIACRVQYSTAITRMIGQGSALTIRYLETCADREEMSLVCPKSKAEQMMISIIEDLKAIAAVQQRAQ